MVRTQPIKDTIEKVLRSLQEKQSIESKDLCAAFKHSLTPKERAHVRRVFLRGGVLTVDVDSSAWLYQLNQKTAGLASQLGLERIRLRLGEKDEQ